MFTIDGWISSGTLKQCWLTGSTNDSYTVRLLAGIKTKQH